MKLITILILGVYLQINTAGYGQHITLSEKGLHSVKVVTIEKQPIQIPLQVLQGRVPMDEVRQAIKVSGGTGRIQCWNSIERVLEPLIVINGVPHPSLLNQTVYQGEDLIQYGSSLNYINPANIKNIETLKGADATVIYGSRAANGVILITTKKGKGGKFLPFLYAPD